MNCLLWPQSKTFNLTCQRTRADPADPNELRFSGLFQGRVQNSCTFWITSPPVWTDYKLEDDENNSGENNQQECLWPLFLRAWTFTDANMLQRSESPCKHYVVSSMLPEKHAHTIVWRILFSLTDILSYSYLFHFMIHFLSLILRQNQVLGLPSLWNKISALRVRKYQSISNRTVAACYRVAACLCGCSLPASCSLLLFSTNPSWACWACEETTCCWSDENWLPHSCGPSTAARGDTLADNPKASPLSGLALGPFTPTPFIWCCWEKYSGD